MSWVCNVCGYIHYGDEAPECCPVCGAAASDFSPNEKSVTNAESVEISRWQCLNCSYIHDGPEPPEICPVCAAPADRFEGIETRLSDSSIGSFSGHLLVVGAGIAGVSAVETFREVNSAGTVTLINREKCLPYYRLNLTRYLAGEIKRDELFIHPESWYKEKNVELRHGEVVKLNQTEQEVELRNGEVIKFDKIVITVGAHAFVPPLEGATRNGVFSLRSLADADQIVAAIKPNIKAVVIGGGLLGLEAAGAMAARKADVTLLEGHDWLMPRQLNRRAGERLLAHVEKIGIKVRRNARSKALAGDEHVAGIELNDGETIPAELVLVATGVRPNSHLARRLGLDVNQGIVVNNQLRSSQNEFLAAGDVAEHRGMLYGSWAAAQYQGSIAGMNAAGKDTEFGGIPRSHTLKVLGCDLLSIGQIEAQDASYQICEHETDNAYYRLAFRDEYLVGCVLVGDTGPAGAIKHAIEEKTHFAEALHKQLSVPQIIDSIG